MSKRVFEPDEWIEFHAQLNAGSEPHDESQTLQMELAGVPANQWPAFTVKANVRNLLHVDKSAVEWHLPYSGIASTKSLLVQNTSNEDWNAIQIQTPPWITHTARLLDPKKVDGLNSRQTWKCDLTLNDSDLPIGLTQSVLLFRSPLLNEPETSVPVFAVVAAPVKVYPAEAFLSNSKPSFLKCEMILTLSPQAKIPLKSTDFTIANPFPTHIQVRCNLRDNDSWALQVECASDVPICDTRVMKVSVPSITNRILNIPVTLSIK